MVLQKLILKRIMKNWNTDLYREILDKIAPMTTIQLRNNYKPWINEETKAQKNHRDELREIARNSRIPTDWNQYKIERNKCNILLRKTKSDFLKNVYKNLEINRYFQYVQDNKITSWMEKRRNTWLLPGGQKENLFSQTHGKYTNEDI